MLSLKKIWLCKNWCKFDPGTSELTHWGRAMHICVSNLTITGSDNGLSPGRRQAIIWTNAGILLIRPLGTNFSELLIEIHTFSFKKMHLKMSSATWRPKVFIFKFHSLRYVLKGLIGKYINIGLGDGLVPNRQQAITWTDDDLVKWYIYVLSWMSWKWLLLQK